MVKSGKREKVGPVISILFVGKSKVLSIVWADFSYILLPRSVTWLHIAAICCCSVVKSHLTLCDSRDCNIPGSSVLHYFQSLLKFMATELLMISVSSFATHLLPLPLVLPSISLFQRVNSSSQVAKVFSFSVSLSIEYSGLISFRNDWFASSCKADCKDKQYFWQSL